MADANSIPFWWVVLFLLLALGGGAAALMAIGGSLVSGALVPVPAPV